ncbi:uncharacterized protein LOC135464156 [Liolophura sinensis]|uniref:uncharacterized protein LOC135464156 n=1 Tax=Liolophura sinensis TaxID=3198878 RepID=UPI0031584959
MTAAAKISMKNGIFVILGCVLVVTIVLGVFTTSEYSPTFFNRILSFPPSLHRHSPVRDEPGSRSQSHHGQALIDCLTDGVWKRDSSQDFTGLQEKLDEFIRKTRDSYKLPNPLQRKDSLCGNVTFGEGLNFFRAVCDPFLSTPCCFQGTCKSISEELCMCPECYDLRQNMHGEMSEWIGSRTDCQLKKFTNEEACSVLRDRQIVFIGDSFMRQMFMGLQILLSNNDIDSCMRAKMSPEMEKHCKWLYMFTKECRPFVAKKDLRCRGTVTLHYYECFTPGSFNVTPHVQKHCGSVSTLFVFGFGLHYKYNAQKLIKELVAPILKQLHANPAYVETKLVWMLPHSMGMLHQQTQPLQVLSFNSKLRQYLSPLAVPVIDTFNLTRNLITYDGSHYTKAANLLKVQILLNYLADQGGHF